MILAAAMNPERLPAGHDEVERVKHGDRDALGGILARYHHRLYRFLFRLAQDPATADDLFQQTWLRVMEKIHRYEERSSFDTWLFSVAHNLAIDHLRRQRNISLNEPDESGEARIERLAAGGADPLEQLLESERGAILAAAVSQLPAIHREVVSLRFEEGMRLDQIAEVAGVPLSTVKSRLHRALESLREMVES